MTAFSYQEWNGLSQEEQSRNPGVSIPREHPINNPNRGVYWSGQSSATALSAHIQDVLAGEERSEAERMFRLLKIEYRKAVEAPAKLDKAMAPRRYDADRALESSGFTLTDEQFDQLHSATDDVYRLQNQAEAAGLDPVSVANAMIERAVSAAVGYAPPRPDQMRPEFREYLTSPEGIESQENLNQSVMQLYFSIRGGSEDALDVENGAALAIANPGEYRGISVPDRTREEEREFLMGVVKTIPLERAPLEIEPNMNFSVRMDTKEEAKNMEMILRWVGEQEKLPEPEIVHEAFTSWKDNGLVASPFDPRPINRVGLIVGAGDTADETAKAVVAGFNNIDQATQVFILTSENRGIALQQEIEGRPVIQVKPKADRDGLRLEGIEGAPDNAVMILNLSAEEARDSIKRSNAANAFVGTVYSAGHIAGTSMSAFEAQAIHLAGSMRKLEYAVDSNGKMVGNVIVGREPVYELEEDGSVKKTPEVFGENARGEQVKIGGGVPIQKKDENGKAVTKPIYKNGMLLLRERARQIDAEADPNRYYAAGTSRPRGGVTAVVFDGARNYDAAVRRYANGKDPMADGYARIPEHAAILTLDNNKMAAYRFLEANADNRKVLYAEATRKLSFAEQVGAGIDTEKVMAREAETELKLFDRPRSERGPDGKAGEVDWNDPEVRGAIILVRGNATKSVINGEAQELKIAQEALIDYAHTGMIFDDMQKDFHAASLTRIALEMGKRFTVVGKEGDIVPLTEARAATKQNAQSFTEITDLTVADRFRGDMSGMQVSGADINRVEHGRRNVAYSLADPVGQMTLAGLKGMTHEKAAKLAKLELTLEEIYTTKDQKVKEALYQNGMPGDTIKNLGDRKTWQKAVERALMNEVAAQSLDARFVPAGAARREGRDETRMLPERSAGYIHGADHKMPVMAFIGNSMATFDGPGGKPIAPGELVDRKQLSDAIKAASAKGYAIGAAFEEGIGIAVLEEAAKIPEAKVVVATSGNPLATSPEMRKVLGKLLEQEQAQVIMPTALAGNPYETSDGVRGTRYADMRAVMQENLAHFSDVAVVVQASTNDQVLNVVDKMNTQGKPVTVMIPTDAERASLDAYRGNIRMARGAGRMDVESISFATVPSAQGYAEIVDKDTEVKLVDGVMRGNAGTFQSARFARSDNARGGHHYRTIGWGSAAKVVIDGNSIERIADQHKAGTLESLGTYSGPTERELEKRRLARMEVNSQTAEMFADMQKQFAVQIDNDVRGMSF